MFKGKDFDYFIGIDVSKKTLDVTVLKGKDPLFYEQINNTSSALRSFIMKLKKQGIVASSCLFCAENTGIYNVPLEEVFTKNGLFIWIEKPLQIKRSQGFTRGKNDKVDSLRIALYAFRNQDKSVRWIRPRTEILTLKKLVSLRKKLLGTQKQIRQTFTEISFMTIEEKRILKACCKTSLEALKKDLTGIEKQIFNLIKSDVELLHLYKIITSVDGIGMQTAVGILITTNEFKNIKEAKKFACYAGVVPFDHSSGSSVYKKPKVSKMANTSMKTLLHMAALSAINMKGEMKIYFDRKVSEGKNKMSVLNAIRNKLVLRIFSCVINNRFYQKKYQYDLVNP